MPLLEDLAHVSLTQPLARIRTDGSIGVCRELIQSSNLGFASVSGTLETVSVDENKAEAYTTREHDLLIPQRRFPLSATVVSKRESDCVVGPNIIIVRPIAVSAFYLAAILNSRAYPAVHYSQATEMSRSGWTLKQVQSLSVPLLSNKAQLAVGEAYRFADETRLAATKRVNAQFELVNSLVGHIIEEYVD